MEALFKKYFWVIKTLGIATACGLAASAVTTQLGARVLFDPAEASEGEGEGESDGEDEDEDEDGKSKSKRKGFSFDDSALAGRGSGSKSRDKERVGEQIRKHNIFCPTCVPVVEPPPEAAGGRTGGHAAGVAHPAGRDQIQAPAAADGHHGGGRSGQLLRHDPRHRGRRGGVVRAGRRDPQGGVSDGGGPGPGAPQEQRRARVHRAGRGRAPPKSTATPKKDDKKSSSSTKKNSREIPGAAEAINCPNENTCTVERAFVEKLMANPALLAKQARIVPKQKDGEVLGYKLYGIRRGSLPKLLGLKNGDMVTAVNGEDLKSMDKAMALYTKLRRASNLSVSIERKGKTVNKEIQIQ